MKKVLALVLALLMLVALFAACKDKPNDPNNKPGGDATDTDDIVIKKFGGEDYKILYNSVIPSGDYNEFTGSLGGDLVQYAVEERKYEVEKQFDVNVSITEIKGGWGERKDFTAAVRAEKMSGGNDGYDLIATHSVYLGWMGIEGLGKDMADYPDYIHFNKPWWNQNLYDALNLKGHVFMMIGDIGMSVYEFINVMFVNETQFDSYFSDQGGVDTLYDLVDAGEWTWEKLWEYASDFGTGEGTNGDGKYGLYTNAHSMIACFISQDAHLYQKDATGKLAIPNALSRKESNILRDMIEYFAKDNLRYDVFGFSGNGAGQISPLFLAGDVLFYPQTLDEAKRLFSGATEDYGILPLPKYDTMQEMYITQCRDTVTGVMIMSTTKNEEKTAIVTEGLAYYGHKIITPAYYEQSLVNRYIDKYTDILNTIRAGLSYQEGLSYLQSSSGDFCSIHFNMFHQAILGNGANADIVYASSVAVGRNELTTFYNKLARLGITY